METLQELGLGTVAGAVPAVGADAPVRTWLDATSWVDVARCWLPDADEACDGLLRTADWQQGRLWRYDHWHLENRYVASGVAMFAAVPALAEATRALRRRYRVPLDGPTLSLYPHGGSALGAHRDRELRYLDDTVVALLSLGARRSFVLRRRTARASTPAFDVAPGPGDLIVLGGRAQADWLHGVPPMPSVRAPRISAQWRWTSRRGRPERGASYRAPRFYGRG